MITDYILDTAYDCFGTMSSIKTANLPCLTSKFVFFPLDHKNFFLITIVLGNFLIVKETDLLRKFIVKKLEIERSIRKKMTISILGMAPLSPASPQLIVAG